jgi:hypothetical protein
VWRRQGRVQEIKGLHMGICRDFVDELIDPI